MNKNMFKTFLLGCIGMLVGNTVALAQVPLAPASGDAKRGEELYYKHGCYACHGYNGIGRHNLANDVSGIMTNEQVFLVYLRARNNLNPALPTQSMPHYPKETLSDKEALDIFAHIRTFKDNPPDAREEPALRAILDSVK